MNFKFYHDPDKKTLAVPCVALQLSKLASAKEIRLLAEKGCVLLTRNDLSTTETVGIIAMLTEICDKLIDQLAEETQEAADDDVNDPLLRYDDEFLTMLQTYEVDLNGLRFLLECESADDE